MATTRTHRDNHGIIICEGDRVAYNRSGDVCLGIVKEIKEVKAVLDRRFPQECNIKVENYSTGVMSTIRNPKGIATLPL